MGMKDKQADVYGQVHPNETPALVEEKLEAFDNAVAKIPEDEKANLWEAERRCPHLLTDDFKLMFLRCEVFDADLAAKRYANYWNKRVSVFGPEKAFQPLTQEGALRDDSVALEIGFFRLTETKCVGGRNIVFCDPTVQTFNYSQESMLRAVWYTFHAALEDEETQKHGFVCIVFAYNAVMSHLDLKLTERCCASVQGCLPMRLSGLHFCRPPMALRAVFPMVKLILGTRLKKRVKVHSGSDEYVRADMEKYGLTDDIIPIEIGGQVVLDHSKWLAERRGLGK